MPTRNISLDALKLKALRMQIKAGVDALERGDFSEIGAENLESYLDRLPSFPGRGRRP